MVESIEQARLVLDANGTPWSARYGDVYHSRAGGLQQAREVFIAGNRLQERWAGRQSFTVLETGFGLGTNFLATWEAWQADPARPRHLHYLSIEESPFPPEDLLAWHARGDSCAALAAELASAWPLPLPGLHRMAFEGQGITLTLALGDVEGLIGRLRARVDAFYLDGFAPSRNPRMWSPQVLRGAARLAAPGATLATYTVARNVADGLVAAGFDVAQLPGFGGKRARLAAVFDPRYKVRRREPPAPAAWRARTAAVIGAGIAGVSAAEALARRGWSVTLVEAGDAVAAGGSGAPGAALHPMVARDDSVAARFTRAGFLYMRRRLVENDWWSACGHLQCARSAEDEARAAAGVETLRLPAVFARFVNAGEASEIAGTGVARGGYWFPGAGWLRAAPYCNAVLTRHATVHLQTARSAFSFSPVDDRWIVRDGAGALLAHAAVLVLAAGTQLDPLSRQVVPRHIRDPFGLGVVRGQMTGIPAARGAPRVVVSGEGYCLPALEQTVWCGATYQAGSSEPAPCASDHDDNLRRLRRMLPQIEVSRDAHASAPSWRAHVGFRAVTRDRLPLVGALPALQAWDSDEVRLHGVHAVDVPRIDGLYACGGLASRGLAWGALCGETIACLIEGEPLPLEADLLDAIDPARFLISELRRGSRQL
jgi:tRNA 5-methylaminomethyl-2-thiouridine biosynthesis bifunctional protein